MKSMNWYKFVATVKGLPFLCAVLWETREDTTEDVINANKKELMFQIVEQRSSSFKVGFVERPDSIVVKRVDDNLLAMKPCYDSYSWQCGGHYDCTNYCAVVGHDVDAELHWLERDGVSADGSGSHNTESAATIGEQLAQLQITPDYIVCYDFKDTDSNGNGEEWLSVTVYKMKGFNLADYHCKQIQHAADQLEAEIRVICEGGVK